MTWAAACRGGVLGNWHGWRLEECPRVRTRLEMTKWAARPEPGKVRTILGLARQTRLENRCGKQTEKWAKRTGKWVGPIRLAQKKRVENGLNRPVNTI